MQYFEVKPLPGMNAFLQVYLRDQSYEYLSHARRPLIMVFPGGGYTFLADREAEPIALAFLQAGYQACILRYSVREDGMPPLGNMPLIEAAGAIRFAREHADEWGIDPQKITVCGFSAGGHLAGSIGVHWNHASINPLAGVSCRPDAMLLCYAVISAGGKGHGGSFESLTGWEQTHKENEIWSLEKQVSPETCPAFIWHTVEDDCVPVENALLMAQAMQDNHLPYALHLFTHGGHGMSLGDHEVGRGTPEARDWLPMALKWLDSMNLGVHPSE